MNEPNLENSPKIDTFRIIPTTQSILGRMILVIILFIIYILFIGWMAILDMKTTPNMSIILDFILDNHEKTIKRFQKYIISILNDNSEPQTQYPEESFENKHSFVEHNSSYWSVPPPSFITKISIWGSGITGKMSDLLEYGFQRFLLMIHLRGNKIFVNKPYS